MNNFNKAEFNFEINRRNEWREKKKQKITLKFNKAKKKDFYYIVFISYCCGMFAAEGWRDLNYYFGMNPLHQEIEHFLYEKVKYQVFKHQASYTELQTKEIVEYLESLKIIKKLME